MKIKILISLFFFLFLFSFKPVNAFTQFNLNPNFDSTIQGININEITTNVSITACNFYDLTSWSLCLYNAITGQNLTLFESSTYECFNAISNTSWYNDTTNDNRTGFLDLQPSSECNFVGYNYNNSFINIKLLNNSNYLKSKNATELETSPYSDWTSDKNSFLLSSNKEGIIYLRYLINDTDDLTPSSLLTYYTNLGETNNTLLGGSADTWVNTTLYIPASPVDRTITIFASFIFGSVNTPKRIMIDYFNFYTYDHETTIPCCSAHTSSFVQDNCNSSGSVSNYINDYVWNSTSILKISAIHTAQAKDNIDCGVFQMNESVYIRRLLESDYSPAVIGKYLSRDIAYIGFDGTGGSSGKLSGNIFTQLTPYMLEITCINQSSSGNTDRGLNFSDAGFQVSKWYHDNCTSSNTPYKFKWYINDSVGSQYMVWRTTSTSAWRDTFKTSCNYGIVCQGNSLYTITTLCDTIFLKDCGVWGCNDNDTDCNYPINPLNGSQITSYGSFCLDDYSYMIVNSTGSYFSSCVYPQLCRQLTSTTIACLTDVELIAQNITTSTNVFYNPANAIAMTIGSGFGITDLSQAQMITSIILSLVGSIATSIALSIKGKVKGHSLERIFTFSSLMYLVLFTMIGWFPSWLIVILIIVSTLVMTKKGLDIFSR